MVCQRFSLIGEKEVINIHDGKRLGYAIDLEIDCVTGRVCSLVISESVGHFNLFCKEQTYLIPWKCIKQIGDDIILVEIETSDCLET